MWERLLVGVAGSREDNPYFSEFLQACSILFISGCFSLICFPFLFSDSQGPLRKEEQNPSL